LVALRESVPGLKRDPGKLAGELGFEPRSSVLETDSLTVELTPPVMRNEAGNASLPNPAGDYFVSLWSVCLRQVLQNFENSRRPVVVFLFFVVE
jgi:hypothetical protein